MKPDRNELPEQPKVTAAADVLKTDDVDNDDNDCGSGGGALRWSESVLRDNLTHRKSINVVDGGLFITLCSFTYTFSSTRDSSSTFTQEIVLCDILFVLLRPSNIKVRAKWESDN